MRRQHSLRGPSFTLSQSVFQVHPIWLPLEKLPISSEQFTMNTPSPSRKVLTPSRKSFTTWRLSTSPPSELLRPCTSCPERSRLWESRWSSLVKVPTRSLVVRISNRFNRIQLTLRIPLLPRCSQRQRLPRGMCQASQEPAHCRLSTCQQIYHGLGS